MFTRSVHPEITVPGAAAVPADYALIRSVPLFRYLEDAEIRKLLTVAQRQKIAGGKELITENSMGTETYILLRGRAQLVKTGIVIGHLQTGSCFGEMSMFENAPRSASVQTIDECELLTLRRQELYLLFQNDPQLAVKLLWSVCQTLNGHLRKTTEDLRRACRR